MYKAVRRGLGCEVDLAFELREKQLRKKKMGRIKGEKTER